jgi:Lipocalin-like domain
MNRRAASAVTTLALLVLGSAFPSLADDKDKLVGTSKLVSAVGEELSSGQKTNVYEGTPVGFVAYGADGRFMILIVDSNRKKPIGAVATAPEAESLFRSMAAYAGTYTLMGTQVIHEASWNETWTGTDQILAGDLLSLATAASPDPFTGKMSAYAPLAEVQSRWWQTLATKSINQRFDCGT